MLVGAILNVVVCVIFMLKISKQYQLTFGMQHAYFLLGLSGSLILWNIILIILYFIFLYDDLDIWIGFYGLEIIVEILVVVIMVVFWSQFKKLVSESPMGKTT